MSLVAALKVIEKLQDQGVLQRYAVTGAVAALVYIQPTLTRDLDVLVEVSAFDETKSGLLLTTTLDKALSDLGYTERNDVGIVVEGWPVQFIPTSNALDVLALESASKIVIDEGSGLAIWVLKPEHVIAKALEVARPKDYDRIVSFLDQDAIDLECLRDTLQNQELLGLWRVFCEKTGRFDPLEKSK